MSRHAMIAWALGSALLLTALCPTSWAAPTPQERFSELVGEAKAAVASKDYGLCVEKFRAAWVIHPDPMLLINAATCLERDGDVEGTRRILVDLLASAPPGDTQAEVRAWLVRLPVAESPTPPVVAPSVQADGLSVTSAMPAWEVGAWSSTLGGAVLAVGGATLLGLAAMDVAAVEDARGDPVTGFVSEMTRSEALALDASAQLKSGVGVGLVAVGGAAILAGIVLFVVGGADTAEVSLRPTADGLRVTGRF